MTTKGVPLRWTRNRSACLMVAAHKAFQVLGAKVESYKSGKTDLFTRGK